MSDVALLDTAVVSHRLAEIRLAPRHGGKALTLWPLLPIEPAPSAAARWLLLERALEDGIAGVGEREGEAQPGVRVDNRASEPLLVLDGALLGSPRAGLRAASSAIVAPRSQTRIPVRERSGGRIPAALADLLHELRALPGQVGLVASLGERILGVELLGCPRVFAEALPGLVVGQWLRACELVFRCGPTGRRPPFDAPETFLAALASARVRVAPAARPHRHLELSDRNVRGRALLAGDTLVHLRAEAVGSVAAV